MPGTLSRRAFFTGRRSPQLPADDGATSRRVAELGAGCLAVNGVTCSVCADPCEPRALRVRPALHGRALPLIDMDACTGCGDCIRVCPVGALALVAAEESPCV